MSLVHMEQIYTLENLPTAFSDILNRERSFELDYFPSSRLPETRGTIHLLEAFFTDPSRSAEFFLGDINAQMAVWSLTSLIGDLSKHEVENQPLPPNEDGRTYWHLHHLLCIYHLSHASILSPVLVKFPTIDPVKMKIQGGDSDSKSEDQLPRKAIPLFICKGCQDSEDSKDRLRKAVTQFLLVCCNRSLSHIVSYSYIEPSG
jgi:hypothetical protein